MKSSLLSVVLALSVAFLGSARAVAQETSSQPATPPAPAQTASTGYGESPDAVSVAADALVVRPLGAAATVVGAAIFVVALPFAALSGDVKRTGDALVGTPARFTFKRRLGEFDSTL